MTEQQLRDVLARVVPEPPESVADPSPVVRVARRRRKARVAGIAVLAAVLVTGTAVGIRALSPDTDQRSEVVEQPKIPDPYTTAPCPDPDQPWDIAPVTDLSTVTAVRFCARDLNGFDGADGPRDALVVDVSAFSDAVRALEPADPARCAAVDVIPTDSRILVQLSDGTVVDVPGGPCQDAEIEGRALDGRDLTAAFLGALAAQRGAHDYAQPDAEPATCVFGASDISPAQPGSDHIVAATVCGPRHADGPVELEGARLEQLQDAWDTADRNAQEGCAARPVSEDLLFVRTDRGDNVQLDVTGCDDQLLFNSWDATYGMKVDDVVGLLS